DHLYESGNGSDSSVRLCSHGAWFVVASGLASAVWFCCCPASMDTRSHLEKGLTCVSLSPFHDKIAEDGDGRSQSSVRSRNRWVQRAGRGRLDRSLTDRRALRISS